MASMDDERIRFECKECCYAISGSAYTGTLYAKIDIHHDETGHAMQEIYYEEEK